MKSITTHLETITPMFLGGADGNAELRPPSIKGLMRFWWRAVKGIDVDTLYKEEVKFFGGTDYKSPFKIKIESNNLLTKDCNPLPHKTNSRFKFQGFCEKQEIELTLSCKENIEIYEKILKITLLLGGLGKRSRRGFGSLKIKQLDFNPINSLSDTILSLLNNISENKFELRNLIIKRISNSNERYPNISEIHFGEIKSTPDEILKTIGQASHSNRDNSLGSANPRLSSPIIVRIQKINEDKYLPIIIRLNTNFPPNFHFNMEKQEVFIKEVKGDSQI